MAELEIRPATERDVPLTLSFKRELADYGRFFHEIVVTEEMLRDSLFGERPAAEILLDYVGGYPAGFALFFHTFSTFPGASRLRRGVALYSSSKARSRAERRK